jgi:hypothetical protein
VLMVVTLVCAVTVLYSSHVYYDHNAALQEVLNCATGVLKKGNMTYWLDGGTLLGAMRHERFVVWDNDVTLSALANVTGGLYDSMVDLASKCKLHFVPPSILPGSGSESPVGWYLYNAQAGLRIMEWIPNSEDILKHGTALAHSIDQILPVRPCFLHSVSTSCPNNGSALLESHFGQNWFNETLMSLFR